MPHPSRRAFLGGTAAAVLARPALAQQEPYPSRPITMVVPLAPGGAGDILARPLAQFMGNELGQPVVIDNRPGGGGTIAHAHVARMRPDGHTILMSTNSSYAIAPHLYQVTYDFDTAFAPVTRLCTTPQVMCVHRSIPADDVAAFIEWLKRNPGRVAFGSAGIGFTSHLAAELFMSMAGVEMLHVPYRGGGPAIADLIGGQIQLMFGNASSTLPHVRSGAVRPLAVTAARRQSYLPDIPTIAEAAIPGFAIAEWYAVVGPAGMPPAIVNRLNREILAIAGTEEGRARLLDMGAEVIGGTPQDFSTFLRGEVDKIGRVVREARISAE